MRYNCESNQFPQTRKDWLTNDSRIEMDCDALIGLFKSQLLGIAQMQGVYFLCVIPM